MKENAASAEAEAGGAADRTAASPTAPSRGEVVRSMRAFTAHQGLWGAWGQFAGLSTAVMTGYALWLGADAAAVALLSSIISVMALAQLAAPLIGARSGDEKRFILNSRMGAMLLRGSILAIPFAVPGEYRFLLLVVLLSASLLLVQLSSPYIGSWQSNIIPRAIRARFTSRATIVATVAAMVSGIAVGAFLDAFDEDGKQVGFASVFAASILLGWVSNRALGAASYPRQGGEQAGRMQPRQLAEPLRDGNFRRAILFFGSSQFALGLAAPFYSVYMLQHLGLSYTTISIFSAVNMVASISGYRIWAGLIDRFGGKPVLQLLLGPFAAVPLLWVFADADTYWLIPVALTIGGFLGAGVSTGITPLMFDLLPQGPKKPVYLAVWSASVSLIYGLGPLLGSFMSRSLAGVELQLPGATAGPLHVIFAASAAAGIAPLLLLSRVRDRSVISSRSLLKQMSTGNLLRYFFGNAVYRLSASENLRARAALALGRSHSPLAVEQLAQAMHDASPEVRREAAHALGESGSRDAVGHLVGELRDRSSDIRGEAAEALGRLGLPEGLESLIASLDDDDPRVRISAIRALAGIKGEEVQELLFWHLTNGFDPLTFPTLIDVLGDMGDRRIVAPALRRLDQFRSPAIRLQLLNAVANGLEARDQFYKLVSYDEHRRIAVVKRLISRAGASLSRAPLAREIRNQLEGYFSTALAQYDRADTQGLMGTVAAIAGLVRASAPEGESGDREVRGDFLAVLQALEAFTGSGPSPAGDDGRAAEEVALAVMLSRLAAFAAEL